jgi:hypothetical protein
MLARVEAVRAAARGAMSRAAARGATSRAAARGAMSRAAARGAMSRAAARGAMSRAAARGAMSRAAARAEIAFFAGLTAGLLPTLETRNSVISLPVAFLILDLWDSVSLILTSFAISLPPSFFSTYRNKEATLVGTPDMVTTASWITTFIEAQVEAGSAQ